MGWFSPSSTTMVTCLLYIFLIIVGINSECGYYAERGIAVPLNQCQHYVGDSISFQYECTGDTNNDGKDIAQLSIYRGNDRCLSQLSSTVERYNKTCGEGDITCNCNGNGEDCTSLLWRYESYIGLNNELETENECDDARYSEWLYVVNHCIPNNNGGSTQLRCFENANNDNIDHYKLIRYDTKTCDAGGTDITRNIRTNCTVVICNSHLITTTSTSTTEATTSSDMSSKSVSNTSNISEFLFILTMLFLVMSIFPC